MLPRKRKGSTIPFGWQVWDEDHTVLVPVEKEQEIIKRARELRLAGSASLRDLVAWIHENTGRRLTPCGLDSIIHRDY